MIEDSHAVEDVRYVQTTKKKKEASEEESSLGLACFVFFLGRPAGGFFRME